MQLFLLQGGELDSACAFFLLSLKATAITINQRDYFTR